MIKKIPKPRSIQVIGRSFGQYTIVEKIGQGGMGEVYRASDSSLKRDVALKFLPESMAQDETAQKRFLREARSAAALDHPYICQIHEIGDVEGTGFIAMEYVSGLTLKAKLREGRLSISECLRISLEITEALEIAQEKGIVHRDLKPANIMLAFGGHVKLMDFGLAKRAYEAHQDTQELSATNLTLVGSTLGTVAHMSPEQLKGEWVDSRSDMFSFGIILYEMLTGVHPFIQPDVMSTASSILQQEPAPLKLHREGISPVIQHVVRKMLAKEPTGRYQQVKEIHNDLNALLRDERSGFPVSEVLSPRNSAGWNLQILFLIPLVLLAAWATLKFWPDASPTSSLTPAGLGLRAELTFPAGERFVPAFNHGLAVSPDGQLLAFTSGTVEVEDLVGSSGGSGRPRSSLYPKTTQLYLRRLGQNLSYPLPGTQGAKNPVFSPDSEWIAFQVWGSGFPLLKKVPVGGGDVVDLCACPTDGGMTWGSSGIVFSGFTRLMIVPASGGDRKPIDFHLEPEEYDPSLPSFLPDGRTVLVTVHRFWNGFSLPDWSAARVYAYSLETGEKRLLLENASEARYVSSGHLLFARHFRPSWRFDDKAVWAVPFDLSTLTITGPEVPVLNGVNRSVGTGDRTWETGASQYSVSQNGLLAYVPGGPFPSVRREIVWVDREGREEKVPITPRPYAWARVGAAGGSILLSTENFPGSIYLYKGGLRETNNRNFAPLAPGAPRQSESFAVWGPGPNQITFLLDSYDPDNRRPTEIWTSEINNPDNAARLPTPKEVKIGERVFPFHAVPLEWSADGKYAAMGGFLYAFDSRGVLSPLSESESSRFRGRPSFSPDGKWIATDRLRRSPSTFEIYIRSTSEGTGSVQLIEGESPVWSRDGGELFFMRQEPAPAETPDLGSSAVYAVSIREFPEGLRLGDPVKLFQGLYLPGDVFDFIRAYDVGTDGRFLMIKELDRDQKQQIIEEFYPRKIHLVQNWFSELERLAPTGQQRAN